MPLGALAVLLLDSATDFFPDDPIAGILTPTRLTLALGLPTLLAGRARLRDFRTRLDLPVALLLAASVAATYGGGHPIAPPEHSAGHAAICRLPTAAPSWLVARFLPQPSAGGTPGAPSGRCRTAADFTHPA
ncbi:hypothetical protein [Streptomyces sp. NPDC001076]